MTIATRALVLVLVGCSGPSHADPVVSVEPPPSSVVVEAPPAAPPLSPPIDLLQSTGTAVAVSGAYRDDARQVGNLVDGDLETAWNGRTGELVGAFIDVRVPDGATVTAIALTAGFTHVNDHADLFTGNHRITRVRIVHDGASLEHALDPESREVQSLTVDGGGGVYRIEVVAVLPGTNTSWQEICVSELRVMGRAPDAREGTRFPDLAVGALPSAVDAPLDLAALAASYPADATWLARDWASHERSEHAFDNSTDGCQDGGNWASDQRARRTILERVAMMVRPVDITISDGLRRRAVITRALPRCIEDDRRRHAERGADLGAIASAFDAAAARLDDDARCRWARTDAALRVLRLSESAMNEWYFIEYEGEFDEDLPRAESHRQMPVQAIRDQLLDGRWPTTSQAVTRLRSIDRAALPTDGADFDALDADLDRIGRVCASH